jgi:hypothetical protein
MNRPTALAALAVVALAGGILALAPSPGGRTTAARVLGDSVIAPAHAQAGPTIGTPAPAAAGTAPGEIDWLELMPPEDLEAIKNMPPVDHNGFLAADQFMSFNTVPRFDGLEGRIAGYIVPLDTDAEGLMTEFFLVPYFGACIHVPPPPPNQIILGKLDEPIPMTDLYSPYWIDGTFKIERSDNELGASAYTMEVAAVTLWDDTGG